MNLDGLPDSDQRTEVQNPRFRELAAVFLGLEDQDHDLI